MPKTKIRSNLKTADRLRLGMLEALGMRRGENGNTFFSATCLPHLREYVIANRRAINHYLWPVSDLDLADPERIVRRLMAELGYYFPHPLSREGITNRLRDSLLDVAGVEQYRGGYSIGMKQMDAVREYVIANRAVIESYLLPISDEDLEHPVRIIYRVLANMGYTTPLNPPTSNT